MTSGTLSNQTVWRPSHESPSEPSDSTFALPCGNIQRPGIHTDGERLATLTCRRQTLRRMEWATAKAKVRTGWMTGPSDTTDLVPFVLRWKNLNSRAIGFPNCSLV